MFIPRDGDTAQGLEEEGASKIDLYATEFKTGAFELTPRPLDYDKLLGYAKECAEGGDHLFLGKDWRTRQDCLILGTGNIPDRLKCIEDKGIKVDIKKIEAKPFMLTHEFITDKSEFEALADVALECANDPDRLLLGDEHLFQKHCMLFLTYDPAASSKCLDEKGIRARVQ